MQHLEVSGAVRHIYIYIYIYVVRQLRVKHLKINIFSFQTNERIVLKVNMSFYQPPLPLVTLNSGGLNASPF